MCRRTFVKKERSRGNFHTKRTSSDFESENDGMHLRKFNSKSTVTQNYVIIRSPMFYITHISCTEGDRAAGALLAAVEPQQKRTMEKKNEQQLA